MEKLNTEDGQLFIKVCLRNPLASCDDRQWFAYSFFSPGLKLLAPLIPSYFG